MAYTEIDNPEIYFQCKTYTGNGSTQTITLDNTDADLDADMIWLKARNHAYSHQLFDTVRGTTKLLNPEANEAEQTLSGITGFSTDSFDIGSDAGTNANTKTFVAWCWKEATAAGLDIVTYSGDGQSNREISHGLSAVPKTMWLKNRSGAHAWMVYHDGLGYNSGSVPRFLQFDNTNAQNNGGSGDFPADPTSSVFKVGSYDTMNKNGDNIVAYVFTEKKGFSKFGTYKGNGSATAGPFIYTGFRPAYVMAKEASGTGHWRIRDNKRSTFNPVGVVLYTNGNNTETTEDNIDFLSNGFRLYTSGGENNGSGDSYVYWAWAENPFVNSNGVPGNAR